MKSLLILASVLLIGGGGFSNTFGKIDERKMTNGPKDGQPVKFTDSKFFKSSVRNLADMESPDLTGDYVPDTKNINGKALNDFRIRFDDASHVMWYSDHNGYISYFNKDGYNDRAFYNNKGRWQYSLILCAESKLPRNVRSAAKASYPDLAITVAEDVQNTIGRAYVVYMEDSANIVVLKVTSDGEVSTTMEMDKE
jgi:hypothetical protein